MTGSILFIGDEADTCDMVCTMLKSVGYDSQSISNAAEGIRWVRQKRLDVILVDWNFHDGKGIEFCKELREVDGQTPILLYTGVVYPSEVKDAQYRLQEDAIHLADIRQLSEIVSQYFHSE